MLLKVQIQPNSKENAVVSFENNVLKLRIKEPAIENKANLELIRYMSEILDIPKQLIALKNGFNSKIKILEINKAIDIKFFVEKYRKVSKQVL